MTQNRSHAVMAQRSEPRDSLDDFPTPAWGTRALCERLAQAGDLRHLSCWEPAANRGYMVGPLGEYFGTVDASDVFDYGQGYRVQDFLFPMTPDAPQSDWIITNPPFRLAAEFVELALERARIGVAMLCRLVFLEGGNRHRRLFCIHPPATVCVFSERLPMLRGRIDREASSATAYAWFIWRHNLGPFIGKTPGIVWFPPGTRARLERDGDYTEATPET